jgi:hypothetical protein
MSDCEWVVMGYAGEHSNWHAWPVAGFATEDEARAWAKQERAKVREVWERYRAGNPEQPADYSADDFKEQWAAWKQLVREHARRCGLRDQQGAAENADKCYPPSYQAARFSAFGGDPDWNWPPPEDGEGTGG